MTQTQTQTHRHTDTQTHRHTDIYTHTEAWLRHGDRLVAVSIKRDTRHVRHTGKP